MEIQESYAQWGEDRLVWEYFHRKPHGFFIEVGANDPVTGSQTYLLERKGWTGILVEPQPWCCNRLRQRRQSTVFQAACGSPAQRGQARFHIAKNDSRSAMSQYDHDGSVTWIDAIDVLVLTLDDILEKAGQCSLDFLSIDVEGGELDVLKGLSFQRYKPALVVVEDYVFTLDVHRYLVDQNYKLVKRTGSNNWYIPKGRVFPFTSWGERCKLFRKMRLGTPLRQLKVMLRKKKVHGN
jgi:FkbM family methyltransferase